MIMTISKPVASGVLENIISSPLLRGDLTASQSRFLMGNRKAVLSLPLPQAANVMGSPSQEDFFHFIFLISNFWISPFDPSRKEL